MTNSIDSEKAFDRTQQLFMIKIPNSLGIERIFLTLIKGTN